MLTAAGVRQIEEASAIDWADGLLWSVVSVYINIDIDIDIDIDVDVVVRCMHTKRMHTHTHIDRHTHTCTRYIVHCIQDTLQTAAENL
jgi:hypothetical protein